LNVYYSYYYKENGLGTMKESTDTTIVNFVQFHNPAVYLEPSADRGHKNNKNPLNCSVEDVVGAVGSVGFAVPTGRQKT
jgi:hypothetical protein